LVKISHRIYATIVYTNGNETNVEIHVKPNELIIYDKLYEFDNSNLLERGNDMAIKEDIMFLLGLYKKIQRLGGNTARQNEVFLDIINMPEIKTKYTDGALEVICEMYDFKIKNGKIVQVPATFSGTSRGGC